MRPDPQRSSPVDVLAAQRLLVPLVLVAMVVFLTYRAFATGRAIGFVALLATPLVIYLINAPAAFLVFTFGLYNSSITLPGIPQGLQVFHLAAMGFAILMVAYRAINKFRPGADFRLSNIFLFVFCAAIAVVISVRGIGLRALGSSNWGGMGYVQLFIGAGFLFVSNYIHLTSRQWKRAIIIVLLSAGLPAIGQLVFILSGGRIYQHFAFIMADIPILMTSLEQSLSGRGVFRLQLLGGLAITVFSFALVVFPFRGKYVWLTIGCMLVALVLAGFSGFRSVISTMVFILVSYAVFVERRHRLRRLLGIGATMAAIWIASVFMARQLPLSFQRVVSWMPGVEVDFRAKAEATDSTTWRFEIWRLAWPQVPEHLWVGKGFSFSSREAEFHPRTYQDTIFAALVTHNYHNGPLSLLLDLGLLGFIGGTGFLIASCREALRYKSRLPDDPFLQRAYKFYTAYYIANVFSFYLIFGDARSSMLFFFVHAAILRGLSQTAKVAVRAEEVNRLAVKPVHGFQPRPVRMRPEIL